MKKEVSFEKDLNVSYVDNSLPKPSNKLIMQHYLCSTVMYILIYIFLSSNHFFKDFFIVDLRIIYMIFLLMYIIFAPIIYFTFRPKSMYASHSIEIFNYLKRVIVSIFHKNFLIKSDYKTIFETVTPTYKEKQAIMIITIKVFFGTLMAKYFYNNIFEIIENIHTCKDIFAQNINFYGFEYIKQLIVNNDAFFYKFIVTILFTVDVTCFLFGYITEASILRNKIRTVETSFLGILFCIMCYEPFNNITTSFLNWYPNDNSLIIEGETTTLIWILRFLALFFLTIYSSASVSLGTKASNLTNRGIVSRFPYNIVRHPAYISKNLFWLFTLIPILIVDFKDFTIISYLLYIFPVVLSYIGWLMIYYFRAITEERHLMQDPDYQEYVKKVHYRFIPFII